MNHNLKLDTKWFEPIVKGWKTFEIRKNDRNFQVGDTLILKEVDRNPDGTMFYTGRVITAEVPFIIRSEAFPDGLKDGYAILSIIVKGVSE